MLHRQRFTWALLAGLVMPAIASAQPFPGTSIIPDTIRVVTPRLGGPDPSAVYSVVIADFFGFPLPGEVVTLDFSGCTHVSPASEQAFPGMTVASCDPPILSAVTNGAGIASFLVMGSVVSRSDPGDNFGCVAVFAGMPPVFMGGVSPSAYDQDGVNGLTANDLSLMTCDLITPRARSDLNGDGTTGGDLARWLLEYYTADGTSRTPARCDGGETTIAENTVPDPDLRLAWGSCASDGGTQSRTFACATNIGSELLVVSFVAPPGVDAMTGYEAVLAVSGDEGEPLASWWRLDPAGCRAGAFSIDVFSTGTLCPQLAEGSINVSSWRAQYPGPGPTSNTQLIRVIGALDPAGMPITAGEEFSLFTLRVNHTLTTGAGSCAGCSEPVAVQFQSLRLTQPAAAAGGCGSPPEPGLLALTGDFVIRANPESDDWIAYWQGVPAGFTDRLDAPAPRELSGIQLSCSNPAHGTARARIVLPRAMRCRLALFDVTGRRRRTLLDETVPAGTRTLEWDGRDDAGQPLGSGYFVLRLITEEGSLGRPFIFLN